jgi:hypothetical protein
MIIHLKNIIYYFLTCNNEIRKNHIISEFKNLKLVEVNPVINIDKFKSGTTGFSRILDQACINQDKNKPFQPFAIFEDDVKKYREFPSDIELPDDIDILYIGLSTWGLTTGNLGVNGAVCFKNINENIIRIYNMLSTHGMIICSMRGLLSLQKCMFEDYYEKNHKGWDITICKIQPHLNVYALKDPLVYQYAKIGGQEIYTKINYKSKMDKPIPKNWISTNNVSILTMNNK